MRPSSQHPFLVFVYGTLKEGFYNYAAVMRPLRDAGHFVKLHNRARAPGFLFVDAYYIPYLVLDTGTDDGVPHGSTVTGEVYGVTQHMLDALDELEGIHKGRYTRSEVVITLLEPGSEEREFAQVPCFVYHLKTLPSVVGERGLLPMPSYDISGHKANYVPKPDRDQTRYRDWGGFE